MLTRLYIDGFKNLVGVDLRFGPFNCLAGANGVGKSNVFDVILFLSSLASRSLAESALAVRDAGALGGDVASVFFEGGGQDPQIKLVAEMILPPKAVDDLGQTAEASTTFVRYTLRLGLQVDTYPGRHGQLYIIEETLEPLRIGDAKKHIHFPFSREWQKSAVNGRRTTDFISTEERDGKSIIKRHQDGTSGRPVSLAAESLPRTVLSSATAIESPTALVVKRELDSWRLLQLEPSRLRSPDDYDAQAFIDASGAHLPATLYRLQSSDPEGEDGATLATIATRLNELTRSTRNLRIDRDDARRRTTLYLIDKDGKEYAARALSDGTLRLIALLALDLDPENKNLLCLEEPENGIHPERIPMVLELLRQMACDVAEAVSEENPLRQVFINTHSPLVVGGVLEEELIVVNAETRIVKQQAVTIPAFLALADTWRARSMGVIGKGVLRRYLGAVPQREEEPREGSRTIAEVVGQQQLAFG